MRLLRCDACSVEISIEKFKFGEGSRVIYCESEEWNVSTRKWDSLYFQFCSWNCCGSYAIAEAINTEEAQTWQEESPDQTSP